MKIRIIAAIVLAAMVCGLFWLSMEKREQYQNNLAAYEEEYAKLQQQELIVKDKQAALDALTSDKADARTEEAAALLQDAARLEQEMQALQTQIETLKGNLSDLGADAQKKQEEIDYLDQVYQALQEGYEKVKGYLAGN